MPLQEMIRDSIMRTDLDFQTVPFPFLNNLTGIIWPYRDVRWNFNDERIPRKNLLRDPSHKARAHLEGGASLATGLIQKVLRLDRRKYAWFFVNLLINGDFLKRFPERGKSRS